MKDLEEHFYLSEFQVDNSSFCFPIIPKNKDVTDKLKLILKKEEVEYRPIISGNLLRHPAFQKYKLCTAREEPNVCLLHRNGLYVGNSQFVNEEKIDRLIEVMGV